MERDFTTNTTDQNDQYQQNDQQQRKMVSPLKRQIVLDAVTLTLNGKLLRRSIGGGKLRDRFNTNDGRVCSGMNQEAVRFEVLKANDGTTSTQGVNGFAVISLERSLAFAPQVRQPERTVAITNRCLSFFLFRLFLQSCSRNTMLRPQHSEGKEH